MNHCVSHSRGVVSFVISTGTRNGTNAARCAMGTHLGALDGGRSDQMCSNYSDVPKSDTDTAALQNKSSARLAVMANDWPNSDSGMYSDQILWVKNESLILSFERWCCFDRHFTQSKAVSSSTRAKRTRFGAEGQGDRRREHRDKAEGTNAVPADASSAADCAEGQLPRQPRSNVTNPH